MKVLLTLFFLLIYVFCFASEVLELYGIPSQGSVLLGKLSDDAESVYLDYEQLTISDSVFVIGFDRDAKLHHIITVVLKSGEMLSKRFVLNKREYNIQEINKVEEKYVSKPKSSEIWQRISNESKSLKAIRKLTYNTRDFYPQNYTFPIDRNLRISSEFGSQRILNGVPKKPHNGLDIAVPKGTPVLAPMNGIVVLTGHYYYNGVFVLLDHGMGLTSIYLHLDKTDAEIGDIIKQGEKIGEVGTTGRSTGNHLHWGVQLFDKRIDPNSLLELMNIFIKIEQKEEVNGQEE